MAGGKWRRMDIQAPPCVSGLYGVKGVDRWMYVGRSVCIATRIKAKKHPIQITKDLTSLSLSYYWYPVARELLARAENAEIRALAPEWNGGTSFECWEAVGPACRVFSPPHRKRTGYCHGKICPGK